MVWAAGPDDWGKECLCKDGGELGGLEEAWNPERE